VVGCIVIAEVGLIEGGTEVEMAEVGTEVAIGTEEGREVGTLVETVDGGSVVHSVHRHLFSCSIILRHVSFSLS